MSLQYAHASKEVAAAPVPYDEEKASASGGGEDAGSQDFNRVGGDVVPTTGVDAAALGETEIENKSPVFRWFSRLFSMGVEIRGIERVPESERSNKHVWNLMIMWWSVNTVLTTAPIGMLAANYYTLQFKHAVAAIVVGNVFGVASTAFIATLGPKFGLRTMIVSRYSVGYVGAAILSILNILTQLGFSTTAVILGGQTLYNISGKLPLVVGVILIGLCSLLICFFGYSVLHHYERYAWIFITIIYIMMYALGGARGYQLDLQAATEDTGRPFAGDFLSFMGIIYSSAAGWAPVAADFNVRLPADTKPSKVFWLTFAGLMLPLLFVEIMGAALMCVPDYVAAFQEGDASGVIAEVFAPWKGGGQFLLVVLAFSVIANNVPNTYSAALSIQALHPWLQKVPRAIWTIVVAVAYTLAGVFGREHFSAILSNFLAILGYWIAFFIMILLSEHYIFRRYVLDGYDLTAYDSVKRLPIGVAGIFAMCCGVAGAVVGMAETWYIGPIGKTFGEYGGDLGYELSAAFSLVAYIPARYLEIKLVGR